MKKFTTAITISVSIFLSSCYSGKHLFILSGQSNMVGLKPEESFTPMLEKAFGKENVIIVKDAKGSQPIRRWYKNWPSAEGNSFRLQTGLYDTLLGKVSAAVGKHKLRTATFVWMQGERDAREKFGNVYEQSLLGLHEQLRNDLKIRKLNLVIGRLSDFDMANEKYPDWSKIREIQVKVGQSASNFAWIDTDDLNDGVNRGGKPIANDLHMSAEGYVTLGKRFAEKSIELIKRNQK